MPGQVLWQRPLRKPQGSESQPQHHETSDGPGDQFWWEAGHHQKAIHTAHLTFVTDYARGK